MLYELITFCRRLFHICQPRCLLLSYNKYMNIFFLLHIEKNIFLFMADVILCRNEIIKTEFEETRKIWCRTLMVLKCQGHFRTAFCLKCNSAMVKIQSWCQTTCHVIIFHLFWFVFGLQICNKKTCLLRLICILFTRNQFTMW